MPTSFTTIVQHLDAKAATAVPAATTDPMLDTDGAVRPFTIGKYLVEVAIFPGVTATETPSRQWFVALKIRGQAASFEARGVWLDFSDGVVMLIGVRSQLAQWGQALSQAGNAVKAATG